MLYLWKSYKMSNESVFRMKVFGLWTATGVISLDAKTRRRLLTGKGVKLTNLPDASALWKSSIFEGSGFEQNFVIEFGGNTARVAPRPRPDATDLSEKFDSALVCIHRQFAVLGAKTSQPIETSKIEIEVHTLKMAELAVSLSEIRYDGREMQVEEATNHVSHIIYLDRDAGCFALEAKKFGQGVILKVGAHLFPSSPAHGNCTIH